MNIFLTALGFLSLSSFLSAMDPAVVILGQTPLHRAAGQGNITHMQKILKNGVTEYREDEWGLVEIVDHKGKAILELKNDKGETALHVAVRRNQLNAATFLVNQGAKIKARDQEGKTPALTAAAYGRVR